MILNLYVLTTIFCWGAWGIFDKKALEKSRDRDVMLIMYLLALPEIPILYLILNNVLAGWHLSWAVTLWAGLGSITSSLAMFAYLFAMSRAEASYVLGITASYPLVMQFLACAFLGEKLVVTRLLGSALIGLGVTAVGQSAPQQKSSTKRDNIIVLICVCLATFGWGVHGLFDKKAVELADPTVIFFTRTLFDALTLAIFFIVLKVSRSDIRIRDKNAWRYCTFSALSLAIGYFAYLKALTLSSASYVIVITGCYPLLMYLLALVFLKEKFNRVRFVGVILVVLGGLMVQLTQSN